MNEAIREVLGEAGAPPLPEPLAGSIVDSHTHLDTVQDVVGIEPAISLAAAREVGVTRIAQIGCDVAGSEFAEELARTHKNVIAAVAIHPNDAARLGREKIGDALKRIDELASVGNRNAAFPLPHGRGDEAHHGGHGIDPRSLPKGFRPRDMIDPTLKVEPIQIKTRDFR